jgi:hypothetical protein
MDTAMGVIWTYTADTSTGSKRHGTLGTSPNHDKRAKYKTDAHPTGGLNGQYQEMGVGTSGVHREERLPYAILLSGLGAFRASARSAAPVNRLRSLNLPEFKPNAA